MGAARSEADAPGRRIPGPGAANFRALIYLNGWLTGRYINNLGPQNRFYLPRRQVFAGAYEIERGGISVRDVVSPG